MEALSQDIYEQKEVKQSHLLHPPTARRTKYIMEEVFIKCEQIKIEVKSETVPEQPEFGIKTENINQENSSVAEANVQTINQNAIYFKNHVESKPNTHNVEGNLSLESEGTSQGTDVLGKVYENGKINRLSCSQCDKTFKNRANLKNHVKYVHANASEVECTECFRTFKSIPYLRSHMSSVHAKTEEVECEHCHKIFMNKKKLNNHIYYTHRQPEEQVSCKICGKTYKSHFNLKIHMRYVHPEGDPHPCPFCYKTFKVEMLLQRHIKWAHPEDGMVYKCQECNKILPSLEGLKTHMKNVHLFNRATCDICKRTLKTKASLERHIKNVHSGQNKEDSVEVTPCSPAEYTCQFCERTFTSGTSMFWHIERYHAQTQKLPNNLCITCNKEFSDYAALHRHLTSVHSLETATCKICFKEFKSSINLQNHIRITHAPPEANQTCETCQKTFKCALHLRMHILAVHAEGEFPCDICQKTFTSTKYLNKHKKSHIESRNFQCDICFKMYKNTNAVSKHKKQVHNGVKCTICNIKQTNLEDHIRKCHPELDQSTSLGDQIEIDEITCCKCNNSISSLEYTDHERICEAVPMVEVKIENVE